jgi:hypothetical protein
VEGAGSEVVGAHDVDAELGALTGCSKRGRSGGPWWLDNGKHGGAVASKRRRKKKGRSTGGGAPFIAGGGSWQRRRELRAERWWQRSHGHGKAVVAAVQTWSAPLFGQGG